MLPPQLMDEQARRPQEPGAGDRPAGGAASAGALLRAAREGQGMHIATLAAAIKVAPRKLEALEQDRWDELPGPTFTRALAQAVCRALKANPHPVLELLPPADTSMLDSGFGTLNEPFAGPGDREPGFRGWVPSAPWLVAAAGLVVAAALVLWWPAGLWSRLAGAAPGTKPAEGSTKSVVATTPTPSTPAATGDGASVIAGAAPIAAPALGTPAPALAGAGVPGSPGTGAAPMAVPAAAPGGPLTTAPGVAAAPVPPGALVVSCTARTWIEVVDARGRVLVSRNLEAGESLGIDGLTPLQLVVGNVDATQVTYKGAAIDLAARTRDNVARLELR